jgi:DNA-binding PadR family transcriptional regulator
MSWKLTERELKRSSAPILALALLEDGPKHGYEIGKLIERRSDGAIAFQMASLYPLLYRLEAHGWIDGRWKDGDRRRRYYRLTAAGRRVLAEQRSRWGQFVRALDRVAAIRSRA